jgi:hypothetical protein
MKWMKGQSGNPKGRPREAAAIAGLARNQVQKHKLVEKLGRIGAGKGEYSKVDAALQIRAIQLLLSYGYGPARSEHESGETLAIQGGRINKLDKSRDFGYCKVDDQVQSPYSGRESLAESSGYAQ